MAGVGPLSRAALLSRQRFMRRHAPRAADMMLMSWLVIAILVRFLVNCLLATRQIARGEPGVGQAISEFSMLHFMVIVFLLPLLSSTLSLGAAGLDRKRLALCGIPLGSVTLVELVGTVTHPVTWITLLFAVPAAIPLAAAHAWGARIAALIAVSLSTLLAAHALGNVLSTSRAAHRISGAFRFIFTGALLGILFSNADFQWSSGSVRIFLFQHPTLLVDNAGTGLLTVFRPWCPSVWIFRGWVVPCVALVIAAFGLYVLSLRSMYNAAGEPAPARRRKAVEHARGAGMSSSAVVWRHELRYLARSLGGLFGVAVGMATSVWLIATREPSVNIALLGCFLALAAGFSYPSNTFGHDGHALRRYALLGPDWGMLFAAKNRAWLTVMGVSVLPLIAADAARVSASSALSLLLSAGLVLALSLLWGNISSVLLPSHTGSGQGHAFVNQAAPFAFCGLPLGIHITVAPFGSPGFVFAASVCLAAAVVSYALLMRRISRTFDAEVESVLARF
jgi:hypothetical protein